MKCAFSLITALTIAISPIFAEKGASVTTPLNYKTKTLDGKEVDLTGYKGKVVLVVNVASACGYTSQYKGMQEIYEKFNKDGFVVLGVPSNEFGGQEPGTNDEIAKFCKTNYGVTFPVLEKQMVKGANASPLQASYFERNQPPIIRRCEVELHQVPSWEEWRNLGKI